MSSSQSSTARGRAAEALAATFLEQKGFVILARNHRVGRDEIDLVALDGATLVCVEVRSCRAGAMVHPLETLTYAKRAKMRRSAARLSVERRVADVRVDVVVVVDGVPELIEGAIDFSER